MKGKKFWKMGEIFCAAIIASMITASFAILFYVGKIQAHDTFESLGQYEYHDKCQSCHSMVAGEHIVGPSLYGIKDEQIGTVYGYKYSDNFKMIEETWNEELLQKFLRFPSIISKEHPHVWRYGTRKKIAEYVMEYGDK